MAPPLVSVVMPVHDAAPFLEASITSILTQTLTDFEFIILDDASTDGSRALLTEWARRDSRIRLFSSDRQLGPVGSSNAVARAARGTYLARMDADDTCQPLRLERQLAQFASGRDIALVATLLDGIDADGRPVRPLDRWRLVRHSPFSPFPHGSIMLPRHLFEKVGGYRDRCVFWEDLNCITGWAARGASSSCRKPSVQCASTGGSTRLRAPGAAGGRSSATGPAVHAARSRGPGLYEPHLAHDIGATGDVSVSRAEVLYSLAASRFWAGDPPGLWERLSLRDAVPFSPGVLGVFVFALWGSWHHQSLRVAMRWLVRGRDLLARVWLDPNRPCEWRFQ